MNDDTRRKLAVRADARMDRSLKTICDQAPLVHYLARMGYALTVEKFGESVALQLVELTAMFASASILASDIRRNADGLDEQGTT